MAVFEIFASNITETSVTIGIRLDPSDVATYRVWLSFPEGDDDTVYFGQMTPGNQQTRYSTFQGLTSGTNYIVYGYLEVSWDNGQSYTTGIRTSCTFTTQSSSETPTTGTIFNVVKTVSENGVTIQWNFTPASSTTDYYRGYVTLGTSDQDTSSIASKYSSINQGNSGTITFVVQFSELSSETYYTFKIAMESGSSAQTMTSIGEEYVGNFTTSSSGGDQPVTQTTISNVTVEATKTSVVIQWDLLLTEASLNGFSGDVTIGPSRSNPEGIAADSTVSRQGGTGRIHFSLSFSNLSLRTKVHYGFKIVMWTGTHEGASSSWSEMGVEYVGNFTVSVPLLVWSWETDSDSWNAENQSGHDSLAINARNALQNKTATTNFSHLIWNDIIDWLTDNLDALDASYSSSTASSAKMTSTPYTLTANKWNDMISLWNTLEEAIEGNNAQTMQNQSAGDPVNASLFIGQNGFITIMNDSIDNYNN